MLLCSLHLHITDIITPFTPIIFLMRSRQNFWVHKLHNLLNLSLKHITHPQTSGFLLLVGFFFVILYLFLVSLQFTLLHNHLYHLSLHTFTFLPILFTHLHRHTHLNVIRAANSLPSSLLSFIYFLTTTYCNCYFNFDC